MTSLLTSRRHFLRGLGAIIAAPAIVRVQNIMPVKALSQEFLGAAYEMEWLEEAVPVSSGLYDQLCDATRRAFVPRLWVQLYDRTPSFLPLAEG